MLRLQRIMIVNLRLMSFFTTHFFFIEWILDSRIRKMKLSRSRRTKTNIHFKRFGHFSLEINKRSVAKYEKRKRCCKNKNGQNAFQFGKNRFFLLFLQTTTKVQQNVEFDCPVLKMVLQRKGTLLTFFI
jgi:hypothetical protein